MRPEAPPRLLERVLCLFLPARDRETISGDLLEEYREEQLPRFGFLRANVWYLRQSISFASIRILGGPYLKQLLILMCLFCIAAGTWLAAMENVLKHNGYPERTLIAGCVVAQGLATLIFLVWNGRTIFRTFVTAGAIGIVVLGFSALTQILRAQHFEGFVLLISIALILQGLLTLMVIFRVPRKNRRDRTRMRAGGSQLSILGFHGE